MKITRFNFTFLIYILLIVFVDILALFVSLELAIEFRTNLFQNYLPLFEINNIEKYYWIFVLILFIFMYEKIYFIRYDFWGDTRRVLKGLIASFVIVMTVITLSKMSLDYSRTFLLMFFTFSILLVPFFKRIFKRFLFRFDKFKINVNIVARGSKYETLLKEINNNWYFGFKHNPKNYDMVLIISKGFGVEELQKMIKKYNKDTKDIYVIPYMDHLDFSHTSIVDYSNIRLSAIHIENRLLNFKNRFIKSLFEKVLVILLSPFIIFVHILISILIKIDSKGPVRFKQKRYGKNAKPFSCYKYRTMYVENDKILKDYLQKNPEEIDYYDVYCKYKNDPRITRIGKFLRKTSLDEFPQFYNILRGDMNLIGPRPYMLNEKDKIGKIHEDVILDIEPGITGLWQVSGRNELTFKERVKLDKWYIQNWSLWMDFVIFVKTIKVVFSKVGAK